MSMFSTFVYSGIVLFAILVLLLAAPKIKSIIKKRKKRQKSVKIVPSSVEEFKEEVTEKESVVEEPKVHPKKKLWKRFFLPTFIVILVALFLLFENNVVSFFRGYAIELEPINYVSFFAILGLIFAIRGSILILISKFENNKAIGVSAFVWLMQAAVLSIVAFLYEMMNITHVSILGRSFSFLLASLAALEIIILGSTFRDIKN